MGSLRLPRYDYRLAGAYFLTICTHGRACLFGDVVDGVMALNDAGALVQDDWHKLAERFPHLFLDAFRVMPNHLHGVMVVGAQFIAPNNAAAVQSSVVHSGAMNCAPTVLAPTGVEMKNKETPQMALLSEAVALPEGLLGW